MMKILWIALTEPMPEQVEDLQRLFPGAELELSLRKVRGTSDLLARIRAGKFDEVVALVPWSMLAQLTERGIYPLYPKITRDPETHEMKHVGIFRVEAANLDLTPLKPAA